MVRSIGLCLVLAGVASASRFAVPALEKFTPDKSDWSTFDDKVKQRMEDMTIPKKKRVTSHAPKGIKWIGPQVWIDSNWDEKTIYNPNEHSRDEFYKLICPTQDTVRGIKKVFYKSGFKMFESNKNPTKAEVDRWHQIALNHVRALVGYTGLEYEIQPDKCLHLRALWSHERYQTRMWDVKYPEGTCKGIVDAHCGASFIPKAEDQKPYLPTGMESCPFQDGGAEGVFTAAKADIPWSLKWSRAFCVSLKKEGFWGGHVGPWFHRSKFGWSWWDMDRDNVDSNAELRAKWGGELATNLYPMMANGIVTQYPGYECSGKPLWWTGIEVTNPDECFHQIQDNATCGKRFMTYNEINGGCGCYTEALVNCTRVPQPGRFTWDFKPEPDWDDAKGLDGPLFPLKVGTECAERGSIMWVATITDFKSPTAPMDCLTKIKDEPDCGRRFLTFNPGNGGCGCYPKLVMECSGRPENWRHSYGIIFDA